MGGRCIRRALLPLLLVCGLVSACEHAAVRSACAGLDPVLARSAFVVVTEPHPGGRVRSPFRVRGCSRTFEANVVWELRDRGGSLLASGHTSGGGIDGPGEFSFTASYVLADAQLGHLEVYERDESDGEGFPGGRTVLPLVLSASRSLP